MLFLECWLVEIFNLCNHWINIFQKPCSMQIALLWLRMILSWPACRDVHNYCTATFLPHNEYTKTLYSEWLLQPLSSAWLLYREFPSCLTVLWMPSQLLSPFKWSRKAPWWTCKKRERKYEKTENVLWKPQYPLGSCFSELWDILVPQRPHWDETKKQQQIFCPLAFFYSACNIYNQLS